VIVLDTHVLVWWTNAHHQVSSGAQEAIESADVIAVSAITGWEAAVLARRRRIQIDRDALAWLHDLATAKNVRILPITLDIAVRAAEFHELLRDPIDCLIVATALINNAPLLTKDDRIRRSGLVETIW